MNTIFGSYEEKYTYEDLFSKLEVINNLNSKTIAYTDLDEYKFYFNLPVNNATINTLKNLFADPIPDDYIHFLTITNGLSLIGDATRLLSVEEVIQIKEIFKYPANILVIAKLQEETHICIDLKAKNNLYMYVTEPIGFDKAYSLHCDFKIFLLE